MSKTATPAEAPAAPEAAAKGNPLMGKLKIGGVIAAIMILELVAVMFVMPKSSAPTPAAASSEHGDDEHGDDHGDSHAASSHAPAAHGGGHGDKGGHGKKTEATAVPKNGSLTEEVDLGEFSVTSYQPAAGTTLFISFHLFGTYQHKNNEELQRRLEDNKHRIRDNIIVIIRSAEMTDLTDAGLGLIKRRILETTNKTLGKALLQQVVFSDFSFVEQ